MQGNFSNMWQLALNNKIFVCLKKLTFLHPVFVSRLNASFARRLHKNKIELTKNVSEKKQTNVETLGQNKILSHCR